MHDCPPAEHVLGKTRQDPTLLLVQPHLLTHARGLLKVLGTGWGGGGLGEGGGGCDVGCMDIEGS